MAVLSKERNTHDVGKHVFLSMHLVIQLLVLVDLKPDQVCENVSESDQTSFLTSI